MVPWITRYFNGVKGNLLRIFRDDSKNIKYSHRIWLVWIEIDLIVDGEHSDFHINSIQIR